MEFMARDYASRKFDIDEVFKKGASLIQSGREGRLKEATRGRGLTIVKKLVDKMSIKTGKNGTEVRVIKKKKLSSNEGIENKNVD